LRGGKGGTFMIGSGRHLALLRHGHKKTIPRGKIKVEF